MSSKDINNLVADINGVLDGLGGWDEAINKEFQDNIGNTMMGRLGVKASSNPLARGGLRMSNLGQCRRKAWYEENLKDGSGEVLLPSTKFKFLYGDILEDVVISLAKAAGHEVTGEQDRMEIDGIVGHRDCVIDGITVDAKSASSFAYEKFKHSRLRGYTKYVKGEEVWIPPEEVDSFGYVSQLSNYVYAGKDDPLVRDKENGAFLAIDKQHGHICLDVYNFEEEIANKVEYVAQAKEEFNSPTVPNRMYEPVPDGTSGNMKLGVVCGYCHRKKSCHPEVRCFLYSNGPRFLTEVVKTPFNKYGPIKEVDLNVSSK